MSSEVMGQLEINMPHTIFLKSLIEGKPIIKYYRLTSALPSCALREKRSAPLDAVFIFIIYFTFFHSCTSITKIPFYCSWKKWINPYLLIVKLSIYRVNVCTSLALDRDSIFEIPPPIQPYFPIPVQGTSLVCVSLPPITVRPYPLYQLFDVGKKFSISEYV